MEVEAEHRYEGQLVLQPRGAGAGEHGAGLVCHEDVLPVFAIIERTCNVLLSYKRLVKDLSRFGPLKS